MIRSHPRVALSFKISYKTTSTAAVHVSQTSVNHLLAKNLRSQSHSNVEACITPNSMVLDSIFIFVV